MHIKKDNYRNKNKNEILLQWDTTSHLLEWLLSAKQVITSVREVVEKKKTLFIVDGNVKWYSHYEKCYGDSSKIKNRVIIWPSNSSSRYLLKKIWKHLFIKYVQPYVHCNIIHSGQDLERTELLLHRYFNKDVVHIYHIRMEYYSAIRKDEILASATPGTWECHTR